MVDLSIVMLNYQRVSLSNVAFSHTNSTICRIWSPRSPTVTTSWAFDHLWRGMTRSHFVTPSRRWVQFKAAKKSSTEPKKRWISQRWLEFLGNWHIWNISWFSTISGNDFQDVLNDLEWSWHIMTYLDSAPLWICSELELRWKKCKGKSWKTYCNLWVFTFQHSKCTREQVVAERLRIYKTWANGKSAPSVFNELAFRQSEPYEPIWWSWFKGIPKFPKRNSYWKVNCWIIILNQRGRIKHRNTSKWLDDHLWVCKQWAVSDGDVPRMKNIFFWGTRIRWISEFDVCYIWLPHFWTPP